MNDIIETTICIDYGTKTLLCWSNEKRTMSKWLKLFPDTAKLTNNGSSVELNGLNIKDVTKIAIKPKIKRVLSDEHLDKLAASRSSRFQKKN